MDNLNSRCNSVTKEYKEKYDKLLSLVNGYEVANNNQNESMKSLADIINNTKELISESEFETLKNEQQTIMKDFARLEDMKTEPFSNESLEYTKTNSDPNSTNTNINQRKKPKYGMETLIEEEENNSKNQENTKGRRKPKYGLETLIEEEENNSKNQENTRIRRKPKYGMETLIEEEENNLKNQENTRSRRKPKYGMEKLIEEENNTKTQHNNSIENQIESQFSLDSLNNLKKKSIKEAQHPLSIPNNAKSHTNQNTNSYLNTNFDNTKSLISSNNQKLLNNFYSDSNKKYDVFSNQVPGQMPTIQIVNVQEAPKDLSRECKKEDLKKNVTELLEKSEKDLSFLQDEKKLNLEINKLLESNSKNLISHETLKKKTKTKNKTIKKKSQKSDKPSKKKNIDYFKEFIDGYTSGITLNHFNKKKIKSKKCRNGNFISKYQNKTRNHNIFK